MIFDSWVREEEVNQIKSGASITDSSVEEPWWDIAGYAALTYQEPMGN